MKGTLVRLLKNLFFNNSGEPYSFYGKKYWFIPGTRPHRLKYENSKDWDVRNDILQLKLLSSLVNDNTVIWDIGACYGEYAILSSCFYHNPTGKIICFEPDKRSRETLQKNLTLNNLHGKVSIKPFAVAGETGKKEFVSLGQTKSHFRFTSDQVGGEITIVDCFTLDDVLTNTPRPNLVKIDVEGAELDILLAASDNFLKDTTIKFLVELHPWVYENYNTKYSELKTRLEYLGREMQLIDPLVDGRKMPIYTSILVI